MSDRQRAQARIEVSRWDPNPYDQRSGAPEIVHVDTGTDGWSRMSELQIEP